MEAIRTLTIVRTDLQGFTRRVEQLTSAQLDAFLHRHRELVTGMLRGRGGTVFKEQGDAVLATFESSTRALLTCIELQRELATQPHHSDPPVIRIMLACGDVLLQKNDVFGSAVNAVSRMEALTPAGEIYFTEQVLQNSNRQEFASEVVGVFALDGFAEPVRLHRTTFRHQTRELPDTAVLMTDLTGFSRFVLSAEMKVVEDLLDGWMEAHEEAAAQHGGAVRMVLGDGCLLTFDTTAAAVRAWVLLCDIADRLLGALPQGFPLDFRSSLSVGLVRVFKSSMYGLPANDAAQLQEVGRSAGGRCLIAPASVMGGIPPQELALLEITPLPTPAEPPLEARNRLPALVCARRRTK